MGHDATATTLLSQSKWERVHGRVDEADALTDLTEVYEANGGDYWATLSAADLMKARGNRSREMALSLAKGWLRRGWSAPGVADATMRKLYAQSEWERAQGRVEEGDAFLFVAEVYERLGYDYRATLRKIEEAQREAAGGGPFELAFALKWFRENWTEHVEPKPAAAPKLAGKSHWPFGR